MNENLVGLYAPFLETKIFKEILQLVKENSEGNIWLTGGYIYRNLASVLYGTEPYEYDIDFTVEHKNKTLKQVEGWRIEKI